MAESNQEQEPIVINDLDESETFTLKELIEQEEEMQEEAGSVLNGSDSKNCSYPKGYVKRQALYACLTCNPITSPDWEPAGICLACSYKCHNHGGDEEIVELYTKRNFRCDCGNKKFTGNPCVLCPEKDEYNLENKYSQNFKGLYCTCHRPYPDPEDEANEDAMVQCTICEDWFHESHVLGGKKIAEIELEINEVICKDCMNMCPILKHYAELTITDKHKNTSEEEKVVVVDDSQDSGIASMASSGQTSTESSQERKRDADGEPKKACLLHQEIYKNSKIEGCAVFKSGWRCKLCKCSECLVKYKELGVEYITDEEDTFSHYEQAGKQKADEEKAAEEAEADRMINSLGHVGQIELIHGINEFKEAFSEFLKSFKDGRVITAADVTEFFDQMKENKRRKLENGSFVPHFCR